MEFLKQEKPALMLLDVNLPVVGGMQVLKFALTFYPDVSVVVMTGSTDEKKAKLMISMGAKEYLVKPFDMSYLQTAIWANVPIAI